MPSSKAPTSSVTGKCLYSSLPIKLMRVYEIIKHLWNLISHLHYCKHETLRHRWKNNARHLNNLASDFNCLHKSFNRLRQFFFFFFLNVPYYITKADSLLQRRGNQLVEYKTDQKEPCYINTRVYPKVSGLAA